MKRKRVLISGPIITTDTSLCGELEKCAAVLKNSDNNRIETIICQEKVDLILLEMIRHDSYEIEMIQDIKIKFPDVIIILIDGNGERQIIARAFKCGIKDAFKQPYICDLIVERVKALLKYVAV